MSLSPSTLTAPVAAPRPPSIHARALVTWIAIFPLVAFASFAIAPFATGWNPVVRAFVLSMIVVPIAVYLVVPKLIRLYGTIGGIRR